MSNKDLKDYFTVIDKDGKESKYEILLTFTSPDTNKNYIVYTDNTKDKEGLIKTYASIYEEDDDKLKLTPIEDDKEWNMVEKLLDQATEEIYSEE